MGPLFPQPLARPVSNFLTGQLVDLVAVRDADIGNQQLEQIVAICNQPRVYDMLFAKRLAGAAYTLNDAQGFITWAKQGWQEQTHFVFLLMQRTGSVVGAADIKSNQLQAAEIGYWLSAECPGVMTHAVIELCQIARQAGYQSLCARVKERNAQSIGVLARAGFAHCRNFTQDGELYRRYEKHL